MFFIPSAFFIQKKFAAVATLLALQTSFKTTNFFLCFQYRDNL